MDAHSVPIIDISPLAARDGGPGADAVVAAVRDACERCGFFVVTGHGVDPAVIDAAWTAVRSFFDQDLALKAETPMTADYPFGYSASEKAGNSLKGAAAYDTSDLKETFAVCLSSVDKPAAGLPAVLWPRAPDSLKPALTAYYRDMERLSGVLLEACALALHMPRGYFQPLCDSHWCALRCLNYPEQTVAPNPGQLRIAQHTDYGSITMWVTPLRDPL